MDGVSIVLAIAWWAPLAIAGGAAGGALAGYLLLLWAGAGSPRETAVPGEHGFVRVESRSDLRWNPWAFVVAGALVALVVGLSIGLSVD